MIKHYDTYKMRGTQDLTRVAALQDEEGHWYVVPLVQAPEFFFVLQECSTKDDYSPFIEKFEKYMTGGDLNLVELYAKIEE